MTMTTAPVLGVDFGTTNTVLSLGFGDGREAVMRFAAPAGETSAFRSVLSFREHPDPARPRSVEAGPWAIEEYLEDPLDTRFIQSFKTFAASSTFRETEVHGRRYRFEDLLWTFLTRLQMHAGDALARLPERAVIGRPVRFAGADPDATLAIQRYEAAFERLGVAERRYVFEPVAAAFYFAKRLGADATVLVADFGGGTSDFSIIRFNRQPDGRVEATALGHAGVGVAGDAFDFRIIEQVVSPRLGKGTMYRSFGKLLPVPNRYYAAFAKWNQLALLKTSRELRELKALARSAVDRSLHAFVELIEDDHGFSLYGAVSRTKQALSVADSARFAFQAGGIDIEADVERSEFDTWIAPELGQITEAVDAAMARAKIGPDAIDQVFLTGGSSFVPAVRRIFTERFDSSRIASGAEFESIASGLALIGQEDDLERWAAAG
jgi:hypothetical chaperone protein